MRSARSFPLLGLFLVLALVVAACGDGDTGGDASSASTEATTISGDGSTDAADVGGEGEVTYPITIEHVYGETVIEAKPERIATVAWANHEVPLALGVVPVGMSEAAWGDDDGDGVLPWVEDRLAELGAEVPVLFDEADGIDAEAVADTDPDVILAAYSGLTEDEYETLSMIAPVVAYPDVAWGTSVQDMIRLNATAMGMAPEGEALLADLQEEIDATFAAHPQLDGKSVLFSYIDPNDPSEIGFYTTHDTRPGFMHALGMGVPSLVEERSASTDAFYETISAEQADLLADVDILVLYGTTYEETLAALRGDALLSTIPAVEKGAIVVLEDSTPLAASANPSPLSIGWGLDDYFTLFSEAAERA